MNKAIQYVFIAACLVGAAYLFGRALVARDNNRIDRATTFSYKVAYEKSKRDALQAKAELHRIQTDPRYYEQIIRENLGWIKDGEEIYIIEE